MGAGHGILWRTVAMLCLAALAGQADAQGHGGRSGGPGAGAGPGHGGAPGRGAGPGHGYAPGGHGNRPGGGWDGGGGRPYGGWHGGPGRPYGGWHGDARGYYGRVPGNWHQGHWYHGPHNGRSGWWWIVGPSWYFYLSPVYPYPDPWLPPSLYGVAPPPPGVPGRYWYYCADPPGYYPYVPQCNFGWRAVLAWPPG